MMPRSVWRSIARSRVFIVRGRSPKSTIVGSALSANRARQLSRCICLMDCQNNRSFDCGVFTALEFRFYGIVRGAVAKGEAGLTGKRIKRRQFLGLSFFLIIL